MSRCRIRFIRICSLCDAQYDEHDPEEANIHRHPEPQSGPPRDAWIASGLPYGGWILQTAEGNDWYFDDPERRWS